MPIEKLQEFARDGQKNTDELSLTDGFPVVRKPARQWFNYLFNIFSLKINEIIDLDPIARNDVTNNLTTNEVKKPLSAAMGKKLQDEKLAIADLVNNLTAGGEDKALTAEQGKLLFSMFRGVHSNNGYQPIANPLNPNKPLLIQWFDGMIPANTNQATFNFPTTFTTICLHVFVTDTGAGAKAYGAYPISTVQYIAATSLSAGGSYFRGWAVGY